MSKFLSIALLTIVAAMSICCGAQSFVSQPNSNVDNNVSSWVSCYYPKCNPGGVGTPTTVSITAQTSPSKDGHSVQFYLAGPAYTNALYWYKTGISLPSSTQAEGDFWIYIGANGSTAQSFEYDIFQFLSPYKFMYGTQCSQGAGKWQVWDDAGGRWVDTAVACSLSEAAWHHIKWRVHRSGSTMYYDVLTVDGTNYAINMKEPAGQMPSGWTNNSGIQFQLDIGPSGKPLTETVDLVNVQFFGW